MFIILFAFTLIALKFCFDEPVKNIVFCGITAYTTQHIAYGIHWFVLDVTKIGFFNVYEQTAEFHFNVFSCILYFGIYAVIYWVVWAFIEYRIRRQENLDIGQIWLPVIAGIIIIVDIVLNTINIYAKVELSIDIKVSMFAYNMLSCVLSLGILYSILGKKTAEKDLETIEKLWKRDKKWYETNMRNVELINVKCHDLKKQIRALGEKNNIIDGETLKEVESVVNIYDGAVKTGNDVIDVALAEKSLICEREGIAFTVIADGSALSFMSKSDLYSLVENALSNATESCLKTEDRSERFIKLHIRRVQGMASIHVENFCKEEPRFINGLPETSKGDKDYHGFGMRSMQLLAEKYGGGLKASYSDGVFTLDVILPVQTGQK